MSQTLTKATLAGSGAVLGLAGGAMMFAPGTFLAMSDVFVEPSPGLMSELTAPSGVLLFAGALMILASVKQRFVTRGLITGAIIYGSYGTSRLVSMIIYGVPSNSLITATAIELCVAALLVSCYTVHTDE
ncbi:MAG: DUF4345 domain-containing protein [Gammaproteobacteria bacterium]|jgi:hypothetical protein|nr:DUF4345 domain-containing protein [Gammaproteobacteria bacterium]